MLNPTTDYTDMSRLLFELTSTQANDTIRIILVDLITHAQVLVNEMAVSNTEKLYLIRFLDRPYQNVNKYVCVPNSWLIWKLTNHVAYVAYPEEDPATTRRRAENHEKPGEDWKIFEAKVEYESDTYEYADIWASTEEMEQSEEKNGAITIQNEDLTNNVHHTIRSVHSNTSSTNGPSNVQIRGEHLRSPLAAFRKKLSTAKKPELSHLYNPLADSSDKESLHIHDNSLLHSPEMVNKLILEQVDKRDTYLNNVQQTTASMSISSNQLHHLSKDPDQQSVVTDNFLQYDNSNQMPLDKNVMERNDKYQTTQDMTPATQSLINLMKRQSQFSQIIQGNTLNVNGQPHLTQRELEIPYRPTAGYYIGQINHPSIVTNNILSASVYKHINEQQLSPAFTDHLQPNPCVDNMIVRTTTRGNSLDLLNISKNNTNNTQHNSTITENKIDQSLKAANPFQTPENVQNGVKKVRRKRRSFAVKTNTAITQNTPSALLNPPTNQSLQNSQNSHRIQPLPVLKGYLFQNPHTKLLYISNLPEVKDNHQSISVQNTTVTEDRSCAGQNSINLSTYEQPYTEEDQNFIQNSCSQSITANNSTAKNSLNQVNQSLIPLIIGRHSPMNIDYSEKVIGVEKMPDNELVKRLKLKIAKSASNSCSRTATRYGSSDSQRSSNVFNKFETEAKETLLNDFKLLLSKMNSNLSVSHEAYKNIQKSNSKYEKTLKRIIGIVSKQYTFIIDHILSSKPKKVKKLRNKLKRKKAKNHDSNNDLNHENDEECCETIEFVCVDAGM